MRVVLRITILFLLPLLAISQEIQLFEQFNGRFDYLAIGNTLNQFENNLDNSFCEILPESSAELFLDSNQTAVAAYLFWAGSGIADTEVILNGETISAQEQYTVSFNSSSGELEYFSCFADITELLQLQENTNYSFSGLDISEALSTNPGYCNTRTNFAGWSIYVIYEDLNLPLNQVSLFQGLEIINTNVTEKTIELDNINVLDNFGAKIGFLAWEGDDALNFGESLSINDNILSNPPLNLSDNAFNGTNSFTNSTEFYNADLDVYDIQDNISIGDTSATIKLTTGDFDSGGNFRADLIILNNIITVLNSQLPDATIVVDQVREECNSNSLIIDYAVYNINSTDVLPAGTPIAFYLDGILVAQAQTNANIPIGGSESGTIEITISEFDTSIVNLLVIVDDEGSGMGIVNETNEVNNETALSIEIPSSEPTIDLPPLPGCDDGFDMTAFNLTTALETISDEFDVNEANFYLSEQDAIQLNNPILNPANFINQLSPQKIYIRIPYSPCYQLFRFELVVENCPPTIPDGFSPNDDGYNDWFNIQGLYDIFDQHKLLIYNRYGTLIFEGNNSLKWYGRSNRGLNDQGELVPVGTYFYVLHLNDPNYSSLTGWVYLNY
ncbi:MAG: gliding motility-associated C-terminal domain-containing protein [Bacteroidia bacterium]|nr:gliding motility-associated C-terminal domain-containing protein [Bacteroidia bacterium]